MKKTALVSLVLALAGIAQAGDVPVGLTGLWRFQNSANLGAATYGNRPLHLAPPTAALFTGPWTDIGIPTWHTAYSDGFVFQESSWNYMSVNPGFTANGGGSYVNEYTVAIDYNQDAGRLEQPVPDFIGW